MDLKVMPIVGLPMIQDGDDIAKILVDLTKALQVFYKEEFVNNKPVIDTVLCIIGELDEVSTLKKLK